MHIVEPKVFVIADMQINRAYDGMGAMLAEIGASRWQTSPASDNEALIEVMGRLCYRSFGTELNANLTRVREGNKEYLENILKVKHGSVIEHAVTSIGCINVSRIFTHELVRHRAGCAFSQESMRFVRLDDIPIWVPDLTDEWYKIVPHDQVPDEWAPRMQQTFEDHIRLVTQQAEDNIKFFSQLLDAKNVAGGSVSFGIKKKITSALRRMAPSGHATNVGITANHRAWRHMIEQRTAEGAEDEIRLVMGMIAGKFKDLYPALYQDMHEEAPCWKFNYSKV